MAEAKFYIIYIERAEYSTFGDVKAQMSKALSWYRITEKNWILYTTSDAEKWYARLAPLVVETGSLFVCSLDISDRQDWMTQKFWDWIKSHQGTLDAEGEG